MPAAPSVKVEELRRIVLGRRQAFLDELRDMVNVDCGSYTPEGVNLIADRCHARLAASGFHVDRIPHQGQPRLGDLVIGSLAGDDPAGVRVLMIGHMDTVFGPGTAAERPFSIEGSRARGPGVSDMKGGLLAGFHAVEAMLQAGHRGFGRITYVCNPDEEIGSPFSKAHIQRLAAEADVALVLEGARENGDVVSSRKGIRDARIDVTGRAAHAGVEPHRGRNAILRASHIVVGIQGLNGRWPGMSFNVGVVHGGTRPNVVPDRCVLEVDIRSPEMLSLTEAMSEIERLVAVPSVPDTDASVAWEGWHDPMEKTPGTARLVELAQGVARELGFEVRDAATGGASDANTTAAAGVPTLDGLGPIGGDDHGPAEWLDIGSVTERVTMLAGLLCRLSPAAVAP
jgi:glutamate carboxypeptidase